jgi:hypothetical protein
VEKYDDRIAEIEGMCKGENLRAVENGGLFAVVSNVDLGEYGEENMAEKGEDIEWLKEKASVFMDIMLKIMSVTQIVPMKFLTIFLTEGRVKDIIAERFEHFQEIFGKIRGRRELSVKIYCDSRRYKESAVAEEIDRFEKSLAGKPKGAAFFLRKKFESELDEKIQDRICRICNSFAEELKDLAAEMKPNKILAKEITGIETPMIINCAYLVEDDRTDVFMDRIQCFGREHEESGFMAEATGPWPPYSFC